MSNTNKTDANHSNTALSIGHVVAAYARDCATDHSSPDYLKLSSYMCWDSVIYCLYKAGVIDKIKFTKIYGRRLNEDPSDLVDANDTLISSTQEMWEVAQGNILGFFSNNNGKSQLIHAMLATGSGCAAGNKNGCIGIGAPVGWEILDLANKLRWKPESKSFNMVPNSAVGETLIQLRYRTLDKFCQNLK